MSPGARIATRVVISAVAIAAVICVIAVAAMTTLGGLRTREETTSVALPNTIKNLTVTGDTGTVDVRTGDVDRPTAAVNYRGWGTPPQATVTGDGNDTTIALNSSGPRMGWSDSTLTIVLPAAASRAMPIAVTLSSGVGRVAGDYASVTAKVSSGALSIDGSADKLTVQGDSGTANVSGTFPEVALTLSSGLLRASDLAVATHLSATVNSGVASIELNESTHPAGGISLETGSGSTTLEVPKTPTTPVSYAVDSTNASGKVNVEIATGPTGQNSVPITVKNKSGATSIEYR